MLRLYFIAFMAALTLGTCVADSVMALRAPTQVTGSDTPFYYVSDGISDNGKFPETWVGFYWNSDSGSRTINYNPEKCNNGGYGDSTDGDPQVTIYPINTDGTPNTSTKLAGTPTGINACHKSSKNTPFTFNLSSTARDANIDMTGVIVKIESKGVGSSRAWFSLTTADSDGVDYGVIGGKPVGYSRDFKSGSGGGYYNLQTGFGSCDSSPMRNQLVSFFDTDKNKYQDTSWDDNALRIQFRNLTVGPSPDGTAIGNTSSVFSNRSNISLRSNTATQFNLTANSGETASLKFDIAANTGYRLNINRLREGNDITVQVPTNEIYGKKVCRGDWTMSGRTTVAPTASPGQSVRFTHYVKNEGPTDDNVENIGADTSVRTSPGAPAASGMQAFTSRSFGLFSAGQEKTAYTNDITIPLNAKNGQQYCETVGYSPASSASSSRATGTEVCVTVQYSYELTPHVDANVLMVRPGEDIVFKPNVTDSNSYPSNDTIWNVRRVTIPPGGSVPYVGVRTNGNFDCPYYTSKGMGCEPVESGSAVFTSTGPTYLPNIAGYTYGVADNVPSGTRICYALMINSSDHTPSKRVEALTCVIVTKQPILQVWGNDVRVGSALLAADNKPGSLIKTNRGSWGEYGVLAPGNITAFGSASNKSGSKLTFANTPSGTLGRYLGGSAQASSLGSIPDIGRYLVEAGNATNAARTGISIVNGTTNVSGYNGNTVIRTSGTVTITGDIKNNSSGSNLTQMVIIADNININPNVTQVDAWLIAPGGSINTCIMAGDQRLTATTCDKQLRINGPITASSLLLRRTFDGGGTEPAEILNLRGDAYMWMRRISEAMGTIHTTYLRELPPRY